MTTHYKCARCGKTILEGRYKYSIDTYGEPLCGSQSNESYCVMFNKQEREASKSDEAGWSDSN